MADQQERKRKCGCVGECSGHPRGSDEWWEATLEMMDDMIAGRPIPTKFIASPPAAWQVVG